MTTTNKAEQVPEVGEVPEVGDASEVGEVGEASDRANAQTREGSRTAEGVRSESPAGAVEEGEHEQAAPDTAPGAADEPDLADADADADGSARSRADGGRPGRRGRSGRLARALRFTWVRGWRRIAGVAAVTVLVLGSGGLIYAAQDLKDPAATHNTALTDSATTDQVIGDVSSGLSQIFAYTPDDTAATEQAARTVLAGTAATQYQALFAQIKQNVATQQLTLTTRVVRAGVVSLTGDRAHLLVFLDQTAQRAGSTATTAAAQLSVTAEQKNGHWRITTLKAR
jgi:Mce-associated membrane protein